MGGLLTYYIIKGSIHERETVFPASTKKRSLDENEKRLSVKRETVFPARRQHLPAGIAPPRNEESDRNEASAAKTIKIMIIPPPTIPTKLHIPAILTFFSAD
ncbi:MAG: hypothetical protein FWE67_03310, partial [Planctomycetaceae bacterium]|nr:hypothetical protein [Planctomycetaceae bacterium]